MILIGRSGYSAAAGLAMASSGPSRAIARRMVFLSSLERWPVLRPRPRVFEERAQPQHVGLAAPLADDLDRGRQFVGAEARRHGHRRMAGEVEGVLVGGPTLAGDAALHAIDHDLVVGRVVRDIERGARIG